MNGNLRDIPGYNEATQNLESSAQQAQQQIKQQAAQMQADLDAQRERELRKQALPITKPSQELLANIAANQESVRQQAEAARADIAKQKADQQAKIDAQAKEIKAQRDIFETANIEIKPGEWVDKIEWSKLTLSQQKEVIATGKYIPTVLATTPITGEQAFQQLIDAGSIPKGATYVSYNKTTGEVTYNPPPPSIENIARQHAKDYGETYEQALKIVKQNPNYYIGEQIYLQLINEGKIPTGSKYLGYNPDTGVKYQPLSGGAKTYLETLAEKYAIPGITGKLEPVSLEYYNLPVALKTGISASKLIEEGFDPAVIKILTDLQPYTDNVGQIDVVEALKDKATTVDNLATIGIDNEAIKQAEHYASIGSIRTFWEGMTPWTEWKGEKATAAGVGEMVAVTLLPGVWAKDWNEMTPTWRGINIAIDVAFLIPFVGWAGKAIKAATIGAKASEALRVTAKSARVAGESRFLFGNALTAFRRTEMGTKGYAKFVSNIQHLAFASRKADLAFADDVAKLTSVTPKQLAKLEKLSGMTGLKQAVIDVSDAQKALTKVWKGVDEFKLGTPEYLKQLYEVQKTQTGLDKMLSKFDAIMRPREKLGITADWDKILHPVEEIKGYKMKWVDAESTDAEKTIAELEDFLYKRRGETPGIQQPLPFAGKGGIAVAEKVKVAKPKVEAAPQISKLKLEPVYKPKIEPELAKVRPPKVTSAFPGIIPKPKIYAGKAAEGVDFAAAAEIARMPALVREKAMREALKEAGITTYVIAKIIAATKGITNAKQVTTILVTTSTAIQNATRAAIQGATQLQIASQVKTDLQPLTRIVPATKLQALTKTIVKAGTKEAVKTTTKVTAKIKPKPKIIPPIKIPLPGGGTLTLTREQAEGIIAWKQGFVYCLTYPPYRQKDIVYSRKPLAGVHYYKGINSALKSIIARGKIIKPEILRTMGIMNVRITIPRGSRKPTISFKRSNKARSRTAPSISTIQ